MKPSAVDLTSNIYLPSEASSVTLQLRTGWLLAGFSQRVVEHEGETTTLSHSGSWRESRVEWRKLREVSEQQKRWGRLLNRVCLREYRRTRMLSRCECGDVEPRFSSIGQESLVGSKGGRQGSGRASVKTKVGSILVKQ